MDLYDSNCAPPNRRNLFRRRPPEPILLHCLRCMHSTEITGPEDVPMNCPSCGAEFGSRRQEPTGVITVPGALASDDVARIRSRWADMINRMSVAEFRRLGLLQEVNRLFLHSRGLALEVVVEDDGTERFGEVRDYRDDPEGIAFADDQLADFQSYLNARFVDQLYCDHLEARVRLFRTPDGVQPIAVDQETAGLLGLESKP